MGKKRYIRQYLKQYFANGCFVSIDGKHVERDYIDKNTGIKKTYEPTIYTGSASCEEFVEINGKRTNIAEMVLTCYGSPSQKKVLKQIIHHKDGDFSNNNLRNLEWIEDNPSNRAMIEAEIVAYRKMRQEKAYKKLKIKATALGDITQNGKKLSVRHSLYDSDVDWFSYFDSAWVEYEYKNSWGRYESKSISVDLVMNDFGFVSGDKTQFTTPVVLHLDNDLLNFNSSNLEWCDETDPRYVKYMVETKYRSLQEEIKANLHFVKKGILAPCFRYRYKDIVDFQNIPIP